MADVNDTFDDAGDEFMDGEGVTERILDQAPPRPLLVPPRQGPP